jgi:hypothetical protein
MFFWSYSCMHHIQNNFMDWIQFSTKGQQFLRLGVKYYPRICLQLLSKPCKTSVRTAGVLAEV